MILVGPPPLPDGSSFPILFHFGLEDGHQCDLAEFDWYINDVFVAHLNFNNGATGETVYQGPFAIEPAKYYSNRCASLVFTFVCRSGDGAGCHDGAKIDVTAWNKSIVTHFISTSAPTVFTVCELMLGSGREGEAEGEPPPP